MPASDPPMTFGAVCSRCGFVHATAVCPQVTFNNVACAAPTPAAAGWQPLHGWPAAGAVAVQTTYDPFDKPMRPDDVERIARRVVELLDERQRRDVKP